MSDSKKLSAQETIQVSQIESINMLKSSSEHATLFTTSRFYDKSENRCNVLGACLTRGLITFLLVFIRFVMIPLGNSREYKYRLGRRKQKFVLSQMTLVLSATRYTILLLPWQSNEFFTTLISLHSIENSSQSEKSTERTNSFARKKLSCNLLRSSEMIIEMRLFAKVFPSFVFLLFGGKSFSARSIFTSSGEFSPFNFLLIYPCPKSAFGRKFLLCQIK